MRAAAPCGRGCSRLARQAVRLNLRPHAAMCWHCQGPCTSLGHASPARRMPREQARSCAAAAGHGGAWVPRPWGLCRQRPQNTLTHGSAAQRRAGGPHRLRGPALLRLRQPRGRAAPGAEGPVRRRAVRPVRCARGGAPRPPVATGGLLRPSITQPSGSLAWMYCLQSLHAACCCIRPAAVPELCTPGRMACCPGRMQQASAPRARTAEPGAAHAHLTPGMPRAARGPADPAGDAVQEERAAGARALPAVHAAAQRHATRCAARLGAGLARKMLLNCCARLPLWVLLAHQHHYTQAPSCFSAAAAAAAATEGAHMRLTRQLLALGLGRGAVSLEAWLETGRCGGTAPTAHWRAARA